MALEEDKPAMNKKTKLGFSNFVYFLNILWNCNVQLELPVVERLMNKFFLALFTSLTTI